MVGDTSSNTSTTQTKTAFREAFVHPRAPLQASG